MRCVALPESYSRIDSHVILREEQVENVSRSPGLYRCAPDITLGDIVIYMSVSARYRVCTGYVQGIICLKKARKLLVVKLSLELPLARFQSVGEERHIFVRRIRACVLVIVAAADVQLAVEYLHAPDGTGVYIVAGIREMLLRRYAEVGEFRAGNRARRLRTHR